MTRLQRLPASSLACCLALLACRPALADESGDTQAANAGMRYVEANVQRDARHNTAALGVLSLPVGERGWVQFGSGQTRLDVAGAARRVSVFSAATGFIGDGWNASLAANRRNGGDAWRQTDWDASVTWLGERVGVGVDGHHRDAHGQGTTGTSLVPGDVTVEQQHLKGPGFGLHGHVHVTPAWRIYASGMHYGYKLSTQQGGGSGGIGLLAGALQRTSASLVSRDEAALSRSFKLGSRHQIGTASVSTELLADKVQDEPGTVRTLQFTAAVEPTPRWTVMPTLGQTHSKTHGGVLFGGIGVTHAW
jgi:hypothetical protein